MVDSTLMSLLPPSTYIDVEVATTERNDGALLPPNGSKKFERRGSPRDIDLGRPSAAAAK